MRLKSSLIACAAVIAALTSAGGAQAAAFVNGGFDSGFSGWTLSDPMAINTVMESVHFMAPPNDTVADRIYSPRDGWAFAQLTANGAETEVLLSQSFDLTSLQRLSGRVAFLANDYIDVNGDLFNPPGSYNDRGFVRITGDLVTTLYFRDVATVGGYGFTDWDSFGINLGPGSYTLEIGVVNNTDDFNSSRLLADAIRVGSIPEPASWAMMILGFFGLGAMVRRRRSVLAA